MTTIVHLTTVHPRFDVRIYTKEAQTLAAELQHKTILLVADGKGDLDEGVGRVSIVDMGNPGTSRLRRAVIGPWRAFLTVRRIKPELVHFHDPELIPLGMLLRLFGHKIIYDVHEDVPAQILTKPWIHPAIRSLIASLVYFVEWVGARTFSAIVPATPKIAEHFPAEKTIIVQNYPINSELMLSDSTPYADRPSVFVYPGVIADIRGAMEMVDALGLLTDFPEARLELAGKFSPSNLPKLLEIRPGWESVYFHGQLSRIELAQVFDSARAGLVVHHPIPNEIDAQPLKMYEYMSAGLPIIASDFPLWRKIIGDAKCGLLVNPLKPEQIAEAMRWILSNPVEAEAMGQRGRQAVLTQYNWAVEAAKLITLYNGLL